MDGSLREPEEKRDRERRCTPSGGLKSLPSCDTDCALKTEPLRCCYDLPRDIEGGHAKAEGLGSRPEGKAKVLVSTWWLPVIFQQL